MDTVTPNKAAERIGVTRQAVHDAIRSGRVFAVRFGTSWLIPETEVERWIERRQKRTA